MSFLVGTIAWSQTAVAVIVSKDEVVIAADSKVLVTGRGENPEGNCKIRQAESFFWTAIGLSTLTATNYNIYHIVRGAQKPSQELEQLADAVEKSTLPLLTESLQILKEHKPDVYYGRAVGHNKNPLEIVFVGFSKGDPTVFVLYFVASESLGQVSLEPRRYVANGAKLGDAMPHHVVLFGEVSAMEPAAQRGGYPNLLSAARGLVEEGIRNKPELVGPPVDLVQLRRGQAPVIQAKPGCKFSPH
jgi:hypothetical protein